MQTSLGIRRGREGIPIFLMSLYEKEKHCSISSALDSFTYDFGKIYFLHSCLGMVHLCWRGVGVWERVIMVTLGILWSQIATVDSVLQKNPLTFIDYASHAS